MVKNVVHTYYVVSKIIVSDILELKKMSILCYNFNDITSQNLLLFSYS